MKVSANEKDFCIKQDKYIELIEINITTMMRVITKKDPTFVQKNRICVYNMTELMDTQHIQKL